MNNFNCTIRTVGLPLTRKDCWHLWTPENHPIIFRTEADFKVGMTVFGLCALLFSKIRILTYELMSNHLHITLYGDESFVREFFLILRKGLVRALEDAPDLSGFTCSLRRLESDNEIRNSITYCNRNGFLVNPDTTPFTYRWGANRFFFNPEAKERHEKEATLLSLRKARSITHSRFADSVTGLTVLDDYACPMSFCAIEEAERFYRNASHYLYEISRNIESHKQFAEVIGECVFYTDDELFRIATGISKERFGEPNMRLLPGRSKLELSKTLHYDYNASKKQLARMMNLDKALLDRLFPGAA